MNLRQNSADWQNIFRFPTIHFHQSPETCALVPSVGFPPFEICVWCVRHFVGFQLQIKCKQFILKTGNAYLCYYNNCIY